MYGKTYGFLRFPLGDLIEYLFVIRASHSLLQDTLSSREPPGAVHPKVTEEKELKRYDKCRCNAIYDTSPTAD